MKRIAATIFVVLFLIGCLFGLCVLINGRRYCVEPPRGAWRPNECRTWAAGR